MRRSILGGALSSGFEAAFSGQGLGGAFETLTAQLLSGLGSLMESLGTQFIIMGTWVAKFVAHVASFDPIGQIEAGVGMIAAGAAIKAIAGSFGGGRSAGGSSSGGYGSPGGLSSIIDRGVINPSNYSSTKASDIQARPSIAATFNVIGPNDPNAVRGIDEILRRINQRGSLAGGFA